MGALAVLLAGALWGTTGLAAHYAPAGSSPFAVGAGSMGLGGLLMLALTMRGEYRRVPWRTLGAPLWWGAACLVVCPLCFYGAMHDAGIAVGTAVNIGSAPVMAMIIERFTGRGTLTASHLGAAGLAVLGLVLLSVLGQEAGDDAAPNAARGVLLGLAAGSTYAGYTASAHEMITRGCPSGVAMGRMFGVAALVSVPFFVITGGPLLTEPRGWAVTAYLSLVPMAFAYVLFAYGLRTTNASSTVTLTLVEPVVAAVLAAVVVGELITPWGWVGMVSVLLGFFALGRGRQQEGEEIAAGA